MGGEETLHRGERVAKITQSAFNGRPSSPILFSLVYNSHITLFIESEALVFLKEPIEK